MKKTWANAEVEELVISETANAMGKSDNFDDTWVQINGKWYIPGNDDNINNNS